MKMITMMIIMTMTMTMRSKIPNDEREKTALSDRGDELGKLCQQEKTRTSVASFKLKHQTFRFFGVQIYSMLIYVQYEGRKLKQSISNMDSLRLRVN